MTSRSPQGDFNVLIIEDCEDSGPLLAEFLEGHLDRLATNEEGYAKSFPHGHGEPGFGQLHRLGDVIDRFGSGEDQPETPGVHLFPTKILESLLDTNASTEEFRARVMDFNPGVVI